MFGIGQNDYPTTVVADGKMHATGGIHYNVRHCRPAKIAFVILPSETPEVIEYRCNICGSSNRLESRRFHRELAHCVACGANARFRGIVHVLAGCFGTDDKQALKDWTTCKTVVGLGMSDWPGYAALLQDKFSYENTFYDREPQFDIQNPGTDRLGRYDFVISSDVFEHIVPPLQQGFDNLFALLKPGGCLVFSAPYTRYAHTVEHYPGLHEFEILTFRGEKILVNRNKAGALQVYDQLFFHGSEGATLEMRLYCEDDILSRLGRAGFKDIRVHDRPQPAIGYYWGAWPDVPSPEMVDKQPLTSYIISARRPGGAAR